MGEGISRLGGVEKKTRGQRKKGIKDKKTFDFYIFYVVSLQRL